VVFGQVLECLLFLRNQTLTQTRKLIVGLGNPGAKYEQTRHNLGFCVIELLAQRWSVSLKSGFAGRSATSRTIRNGVDVGLMLPLTFMNRSGAAVKQFAVQGGYESSDILVVCDDLNLPFGQLRLRPRGSDGGHNGLASIIALIQTEDFPRLRMGIGHPGQGRDVVDYVLEKFSRSESGRITEFVSLAADCCETWIQDGVDKAMEEFNRKQ
jgi:PTH1 family peptidyl-tRNA hydrolase